MFYNIGSCCQTFRVQRLTNYDLDGRNGHDGKLEINHFIPDTHIEETEWETSALFAVEQVWWARSVMQKQKPSFEIL